MSNQGKDLAKQKKLQKDEKEVATKTAGKAQQTELKEFEYENATASGEKKNLDGAWPPAYNPSVIEQSWYEWWEKSGFFEPQNQKNILPDHKFTIVIPPPNITGQLHIGHALTNAVQDALARYYRMSGYKTEWLAGTDHAGISTQVVVEKQLAAQKISRHDIGREKFVAKAWEWKEEYGGRIFNQLRKLGSSLDWNRQVFTLDEQRTQAHDEMFARFFNDGLIYRDNRLVGWDCQLQTAISDVEVEYLEVKTPIQMQIGAKKYPFGYLWNFSYPVIIGEMEKKTDQELAAMFDADPSLYLNNSLTFGTTRPETMIGDSAIAIHPDDERYKQYQGKSVFHPIRRCMIPVVCDPVLVDMAFGTGVVKVTPAHDPNDFETGKRHQLEFINILTKDGKINAEATPFHGMPRLDARIEVIKFFQNIKCYHDKTPNPMSIGLSQRSRDVVEPMMVPQWYVDCRGMAKKALDAVSSGELLIVPKTHEQTWRNYLENIRPWCISRQLWWGHQIPLYKVWLKGLQEPDGGQALQYVVGRNDEEAVTNGCKKLNCQPDQLQMFRDPDVTDTWFSSAMFPFSSFNWPNEEHPDFKDFFPGEVLETGYDILFFWVARMSMVSLQLFNKLPFKEIYLHAMVRDSKGEKMSKSKGNVIDPLDCINGISLDGLHQRVRDNSNISDGEKDKAMKLQKAEFPAGIPQCGTDALRLALCLYTGQGRQINLDVNNIIAQRNFCNKIFNSVKFTMTFCRLNQKDIDGYTFDKLINEIITKKGQLSVANGYILQQLGELVHHYNKAMRTYDISKASDSVLKFYWDIFCDYYVELVKPVIAPMEGVVSNYSQEEMLLTRRIIFCIIDQCLRLLHPIMPFITEEMFQRIPRWENEKELKTLMLATFPKDCRKFNFGNQEEYTNYDELLLDKSSLYQKLAIELIPYIELFKQTQQLILAARSLRASYKIGPSAKVACYIQSGRDFTADQLSAFSTLALCSSVTQIKPSDQKPQQCGVSVVSSEITLYIELHGLVDASSELAKLEKERLNVVQQQERLQKQMADANYGRLPEQLRQQNEEKVVQLQEKLAQVEELKHNFQALL